MSLKLFFACAFGVVLSLHMVSCNTTADASNVSISQMDDLDQQWGLPKRKPRGAPQRRYQYRADDVPGASMGGRAPAMVEPRETINAAPPSSIAPAPEPPSRQIDPNAINSLR